MPPRASQNHLSLPKSALALVAMASFGWAFSTLVDTFRADGSNTTQVAARNREMDKLTDRVQGLEAAARRTNPDCGK